VLLFNGRDWHANSPFMVEGDCERLSVVAYYLKRMLHCGTAEEELNKARTLRTSRGKGNLPFT
jgi:hypothetical protein